MESEPYLTVMKLFFAILCKLFLLYVHKVSIILCICFCIHTGGFIVVIIDLLHLNNYEKFSDNRYIR